MGSYCTIEFDGWEVCSSKAVVPDSFAALFLEKDRDLRPAVGSDEEGEPWFNYRYTATRSTILRRMSILGATQVSAAKAFDSWLKSERETWEEYRSEGWGIETADALANLSLEEWTRRVPDILASQYDTHEREPADEIDKRMRDLNDSWLWFAGYGSLLSLRALLDACPEVQTVTLDMSDLVGNGYYGPDRPLDLEARRYAVSAHQPLAPTMILAEGSSDIRVLKKALEMLHPDLVDYFSFFNHSDLNVDGGATYLVKFLKAFAAANMPLQLMAIFDNDTIGRQAFQQAQALNLPPNMVLTTLPDSELARNYPTVGPQGAHFMDVNGKAAGIEIYLGERSLKRGEELRPVRWTGFVNSANAYQGEVEGKNDVLEAFMQSTENIKDPSEASERYKDLARVWDHLIALVETNSEAALTADWQQRQYDL